MYDVTGKLARWDGICHGHPDATTGTSFSKIGAQEALRCRYADRKYTCVLGSHTSEHASLYIICCACVLPCYFLLEALSLRL